MKKIALNIKEKTIETATEASKTHPIFALPLRAKRKITGRPTIAMQVVPIIVVTIRFEKNSFLMAPQ
jgi:hypothetical protein